MDLVRKYMMSTAMLRAADGDGAVADPPVAADPPAIDPAATVDPVAGDPPAADPPRNQPPKWALDRISAETAKREQSEQRAAEAERRAADAEALAARLQAGTNNADPAAARTPPAPAPAPAQDLDRLVNERAQQIRLNEDSSAIKAAGINEYGAAFGDTLSILNAVGAVSDDIVLNLVAVDKTNGHKILATLAKDPEKAASFAKLDSRRQIAELTRMSDALKAPAAAADPKAPPAAVPVAVPPKTGSRAPAPPPPVDPSASKTIDWRSDEASDADFSKGWNETMERRAARR